MKTLALFDFDGTITSKDSLTEFFRIIQPDKRKRFIIKYVQTFPHIALYKLCLLSSNMLKKARIRAFFRDKAYAELKSAGMYFADNILPNLIKKSASEAIDQHLANGDDVFIVSASLDIILQSWCKQRGVGMITNIVDPQNNCYTGYDCNGIEKVRKIKERIDLEQYTMIYAYGDTTGDKPMLELAHKPYYQYFT
jgi:HAD superfamily hydrolase (TIGR01490 family)